MWSWLRFKCGFFGITVIIPSIYRVLQCYCHPLYKTFFKHQQKCCTESPLIEVIEIILGFQWQWFFCLSFDFRLGDFWISELSELLQVSFGDFSEIWDVGTFENFWKSKSLDLGVIRTHDHFWSDILKLYIL